MKATTNSIINSNLQEVRDIVDGITCDIYADDFYDTFGISLVKADLSSNKKMAAFWSEKYNSILDSLKI